MKLTYASVDDILTEAGHGDIVAVFPTFPHAIEWWPRIQRIFLDRHEAGCITKTKTNIVCRCTKTFCRLWIPYPLNPTMAMDWPQNRRRRYRYFSLYGFAGSEINV